ncbi:MAG: MBOAT family O-acyltransferase [Flavobacteriaceae bacterium]
MLFNSVDFLIFLPIVFLVYWFVVPKDLQKQNFLLLIASYFFYACWDLRFLPLLMASTLLDFYTGAKIHQTDSLRTRKLWLMISIGINLSILGVFKYYNFFAESLMTLLSNFGLNAQPSLIQVILPVGISFYTFHGLSYVIDLYNQKIKPERNFISYAVFVCFFPLLVAGPIERASHLLPQITRKRSFDYQKASEGMRQILWGLFKKIVIADNCAIYVNTIFDHHQDYSGSTLLLGSLFFSFQIYGDFSGYSDIALGTARLFGIELLQNFSFPFFSRDIAEFWRRWHISLSSWFRDYLYIPLGGSRKGQKIAVRNIFIIFIVSGFWHGANWTFVFWGALHALYFLLLVLSNQNKKNVDILAQGKQFPTLKDFFSMLLTFVMVTFAFIFFRSENLTQAFAFISGILSPDLFSLPYFLGIKQAFITSILILFMLFMEWFSRAQQFGIQSIATHWKRPYRWLFYYCITLLIFLFGTQSQEFIYFQF